MLLAPAAPLAYLSGDSDTLPLRSVRAKSGAAGGAWTIFGPRHVASKAGGCVLLLLHALSSLPSFALLPLSVVST